MRCGPNVNRGAPALTICAVIIFLRSGVAKDAELAPARAASDPASRPAESAASRPSPADPDVERLLGIGDAPPPRTPHVRFQDGQVYALEIRALGNFDYDPAKGNDIPADVRALSGATLRLHGYMIPLDQAETITDFMLVPSLFSCCFGQPPAVQHTVLVHCPADAPVAPSAGPVSVTGTLTVREKKDGSYVTNIFELRACSVFSGPAR